VPYRPTTMRRLLMYVAAGTVLLAGCGQDVGTTPAEVSTTDPTTTPTTAQVPDQPPPIVLGVAGRTVETQAGSSCWMAGGSGVCSDAVSVDPDKLPLVEDATSVDFSFPVTGWAFQASFTPVAADKCTRSYTLDAADTGSGGYAVQAAGPAGDYVVSLFGRGPQGDVAASFRWRTSSGGVVPAPTATTSIVWAPDGQPEGQAFRLDIDGLTVTPDQASATVTATAANGRSATLDAAPGPGVGCPPGWLSFSEKGSAFADRVAALGPAPFTYDVTLTLDGVAHHATATWPDDHVADPFDDDPAPVPLVFDPALE
jgi:hypothetical protein